MKKESNQDLAKELGLVEAFPSIRRRKHSDNEHRLQCNCVRWFRLQYRAMRHNLFAVPNGGERNVIVASKMKLEGVLPGVSDLVLLRQNSKYGALLIEMKTAKGKQTELQKEWENMITKDGYKYVICRSLDDFKHEIEAYLKE